MDNKTEHCVCGKCKRTMKRENFYTYKDGKPTELCKACLTLHVNNFEPETFLWILEKFDVPYVEAEWNVLRDRAYQKDPYKMTGMSVLGRYLSKMKLRQWQKYTWADTERLQEEAKVKQQEMEERQQVVLEQVKSQYEEGLISEVQYKTYVDSLSPGKAVAASDSSFSSNDQPYEEIELIKPLSFEDQLTEDDKLYLATKWGSLYSADEWIWLERKYNDFHVSFEVKGASREDSLIMICKTSLKMNQAIDSNDVETYQKLSRVYDSLTKSGKFTEAQVKEKEEQKITGIGELVYLCEKEKGRIPEYRIDIPKDIIDNMIQDTQNYMQSLFYRDPNMGSQLDAFLKRYDNLQSAKREKQEYDQMTKEDKDFYKEMSQDDYTEFYDMMQENMQADIQGGEFDWH